jgi:hypothetical protein
MRYDEPRLCVGLVCCCFYYYSTYYKAVYGVLLLSNLHNCTAARVCVCV